MNNLTHFAVNPIAGALGAEVAGVDLGKVSDGIFQELRAAFLEHQVLFFRDQEITRDQHKAFARRFGSLRIHPLIQPFKTEGHPEITVVWSNEQKPIVAEEWHSDATFLQEPCLGSVLRCVETPVYGGDTMWASMYAAYEALSDKMQHMITGLAAIHNTARSLARPDYRTETPTGNNAQEVVCLEHPVVRTHPETRRKGLFVNSIFTASIKGMKPKESALLLEFLYRHIDSSEFSCRFRWRPNSVALWDDRCTQHRVCGDNRTANRRLERVTILGDRPF